MPVRTRLPVVKARYRQQLFDDPRLNFAPFKIGYLLADRITMDGTAKKYHQTGRIEIWGSQEEIANEIGCNVSTVNTAIKKLIRCGHLLKIKGGNQYTGSNIYRVIMKKEERHVAA